MIVDRHGLENIDTRNSELDVKDYLNSYLIDRTKGTGIMLKHKTWQYNAPRGIMKFFSA